MEICNQFDMKEPLLFQCFTVLNKKGHEVDSEKKWSMKGERFSALQRNKFCKFDLLENTLPVIFQYEDLNLAWH